MRQKLITAAFMAICLILMATIAVPIMNRRRAVRDLQSLSRDMSILGSGIQLFTQHNGGRFPDDIRELNNAEDIGVDRAENLERHVVYLGKGLRLDRISPKQVIAMERPDDEQDIACVLLADGSVLGVPSHDVDNSRPSQSNPTVVTTDKQGRITFSVATSRAAQ